MLSLQRTLSLGYLQQRWMRALLVLLSIALGVATLVATRTLNRNLNQAAQASVHPLSGLADLMIVNGAAGVPLDTVKVIDPQQRQPPDPELASILNVQPLVLGRVFLPSLDNRSVQIFGVNPPLGDTAAMRQHLPEGLAFQPLPALGPLEIARALLDALLEFRATGKCTGIPLEIARVLFLGKVPVAVGPKLAKDLGLTATEGKDFPISKASIPIRAAGVEKQTFVVGVVLSQSPHLLLDPSAVYMQLGPAASLVFPTRPEYVSEISVKLRKGADRNAVRRWLQEVISSPLKVHTVDEINEKVRDITAGLELGFAIGGTLALVVGLFLVYNVLSVSVAERRHEIGILRSVGATRSQVAGLFVFEASFLGLIGSLLGLPIGYGLARVAQGPISRVLSDAFQPVEQPALVIDAWTLLLALGAGLATTMVAALIPALQAAGEEPADVVRRVPAGNRLLYRVLQVGLSGLLLLIGGLCVIGREYLPLRVGTFAGIASIFVACLVATPLLAVAASKFLQPFFRFFLGLEGRLAVDNLARSPGRTGIVIAALAATGALLVQTAGFIHSSEDAILSWLEEAIAADLFVTSGSPITRPSENVPMDESLRRKILEVPRVDAVVGARFHALSYRDRVVILLALDAHAFDHAQEHYSLARNLTHHPRLREPGTVLISENFAALYKVKVGDRIQIDGLDGPLTVEVIGTMVDYTWNRGTLLVDRSWFQEKYRDNQVDVFDVYLRPEDGKPATEKERAAVIAELKSQLGRKEALQAVTRPAFRDEVSNQLRRVYGLAYAQQAVVGIVALLGVISALFISVLQRRRELGLLRAVGASRDQVLRSVLAEAVLMGLVGAILGLAIGVLLEWYFVKIVLLDEAGFIFTMLLPWQEAGIVFGLSILLATVVGLGPAYHATQIRIAEAIAYE